METNETVFCQNQKCGKEYNKSFKKCPFCSTENQHYCKETVSGNRKKVSPEGTGKKILRLIISVVVSILAILTLSLLQVTLRIDGVLIGYINAGLSITLGAVCNKYLKKKFSTPKK